jgi:tetratricopeptide (TPR) repeat protein
MSTRPAKPPPSCPNPETLGKLLRDELSGPEASPVEEHVGDCPGCQQELHRLVGSVPGLSGPLPERCPHTLHSHPADVGEAQKRGHAADEEPPVLPGHEPLGRIDGGGMGVVWRVRDLDFQRILAVKVMKSGECHNPRAVRRFLAEARITGQLAHPSLVPVHAQGRLADGRPYYTMKLVEGETLAALLARPDAAGRQAEMLRVFTQVCQAVAYAHTRGVIHRDLTPANVMVGAFGEVQVVDWGLAKMLDKETGRQGDQEREASSVSLSPCLPVSLSHETQAGTVMGTLRYMPPEQARGEVGLLDRRCDVFNLGAILCELLTGEPPYRCGSREELRRQAANGELADAWARLDGCGAEEELVCLAKACLAPNREERPADAGAVAGAMVAYQARAEQRLRRMDMERCEAQVRAREERNRRRLASALAAAVLAGLVGLAIGTALLAKKNQQLIAANGQLDVARTEAVNKGDQAARARDRTFQALDAMTSSVTGDSLETQRVITAEQKQFLNGVLSYYEEFAKEQGDDEATRRRVAAAAQRVGTIHYRLGFVAAAVRAYEQARDSIEKLAADSPGVPQYRRELATNHSNLGVLLHELGKRPEAEAAFRQALALRARLAADFPEVHEYRRGVAGAHDNLGTLLVKSGRYPEAEAAYRRALGIREKLTADHPAVSEHRQNLAVTFVNLGNLLLELGKRPEAEEAYRKAVAILEKLAADSPGLPDNRRELAGGHNNLGALLRELGKRPQAEAAYRKALALLEKLAADSPGVAKYRRELAGSHNNLGNLLRELGRRPEAEEAYRQALALRTKLAADSPDVPQHRRDLAASFKSLGALLRELGRRPEAEVAYRKALALLEKLAADYPGVAEYRQELASIHNNLGNLLRGLGRRPDAEEAHRKALALRTRLAADFPNSLQYRQDLASSHNNLGNLLRGLGERSEAEAAFRQALALQEKLAADSPAPRFRRDLAGSLVNLGLLLGDLDRPREAEAAHRKALALLEKLAADYRDVPEYRARLAAGQVNLGHLLYKHGKATEALASYDRAITLLKPLAEAAPRRAVERQFLRNAHRGRAVALVGLERPSDALADWDRAVDLSSAEEKAMVRADRAYCLVLAGQVERAVAEAADLAKSAVGDGRRLYQLACVYALAAGGQDEKNREVYVQNALQLLRRAVAGGFKDAEQLKKSADLKLLRDRAEFREVLAEVEERLKKAQE